MSPKTKDWIKLIAIIFGTGAAVTVTCATGGMKPWLAILMGLGVAGTNVGHAMSDKPGQISQNENPKP